MAKELSTQDLVNELEKAVKESKEFVKVLSKALGVTEDIAKTFKDSFGKIDTSSSKGLAEFNKLIKQTNELTEKQLDLSKEKQAEQKKVAKQEQQIVNLRKKLADGLKEETLEVEKLKIQVQEQNKQRN